MSMQSKRHTRVRSASGMVVREWAVTPVNADHAVENRPCAPLEVEEPGTATMRFINGIGMCFVDGDTNTTITTKRVRTKKQLLGDASTDRVVAANFNGSTIFESYVADFAVIIHPMLLTYCDAHDLLYDRDVSLVFKGGNVFRMYFTNFVVGVDHFQHLLKHSDVDFQLYVSSTLPAPHIDALSRVCVEALQTFRRFLQVGDGSVKYSALLGAPALRTDEVKDYEAHLPEGCKIMSISTVPREDFFVLEPSSKLGEQVISPASRHTTNTTACRALLVKRGSDLLQHTYASAPVSPLYISVNNTVRFGTAHERMAFDLIRMKLNLDIEVRAGDGQHRCTHAPSEMVDISLSYPDDIKLKKEEALGLHWWTTSTVFQSSTGKSVDIRIPTLGYLINCDLHHILFRENIFPWDDLKYTKRLQRYILGRIMLSLELQSENALRRPAEVMSAYFRYMPKNKLYGSVIDTIDNFSADVQLAVASTAEDALEAFATHPLQEIMMTINKACIKLGARQDNAALFQHLGEFLTLTSGCLDSVRNLLVHVQNGATTNALLAATTLKTMLNEHESKRRILNPKLLLNVGLSLDAIMRLHGEGKASIRRPSTSSRSHRHQTAA